jgi:hypothetical protein
MSTLADSLNLALQLLLAGDAQLLGIAALSLRVSLTACAVGALAGLLLGAWLAVARFPGHALLVGLLNTLLVAQRAAGQPRAAVHAHRHGGGAKHPGGAADRCPHPPPGARCAARGR